MDPKPATNFAGEMTWDVVKQRFEAGAFAILPIGAGAKQHARHLPMCADAIQAEWLASCLSERVSAVVWPTVNYGHYPAFTAYTGSCSLSSAVFEAVIRELTTSLLEFGARGVLIIDTGLSTMAPIGRAIAEPASVGCVLHLNAYQGHRYRKAAARLTGNMHVGHADELETSCLLAIAPELVRMDRAVVGLLGSAEPGPLQHVDATAANYSEFGGVGDPSRATAEKGRVLVAAMVDDMVEAVCQISPPSQ